MARLSRWLALFLGAVAGLVLAGTLATAQPFPANLQVALTQLTTGVIPFAQLTLVPDAYLNWDDTAGDAGYGLRDLGGFIQIKHSGGAWATLSPTGSGDLDASYITRVPEANLTNETALSGLASALLVNTTTTGVLSAYAGTSCTDQILVALSALGVATCADVDFDTLTLTGTLGVARGGTGLTSGTAGGVLAFTASGTLASSAALAANQLVLGGGAGVVPATLGNLGTATQVLHGNASGAPTFGAVSLTTTVTGILPSANGGTGSAFFAVAGPASTVKTYTFPNASATILTDAVAITAAQGGTGQTSYVIGDLLQATGTTTLSRLAAVATGNALISGGVGTASSWGKVGLTTHVSGTLGPTNGGTGFASYTTGDLLYANSTSSLARLTAVAAGRFLRSAGTGTAPAWSTLILPNSATEGDLLVASTANTIGTFAAAAAGRVLASAGTGTAPVWSATPTVASLTLDAAAVGDTLQTQQTATAGDDVQEITRQYRVTTATATPTVLATFAIPATTTLQQHCAVTARRTSGASGTAEDGAGYLAQAVYKNVAGTATEIGEVVTAVGESQVAWDVAFDVSSGNGTLLVTGAANNTITWHATCRSYLVGS
jgi:hypothetical protein